jgi:CheY-like chemotaxis protein
VYSTHPPRTACYAPPVPERRRIVYVEDNAANLALVVKVLQHGGEYEVVGAPTGEDGLELVRAAPPDLVLLDLDLPEMSGFDVVTALKQDEGLAAIPVVAISASVMKQERQQALEAGCAWFIEKPFDLAELRAVVADAIAGRLPASSGSYPSSQ